MLETYILTTSFIGLNIFLSKIFRGRLYICISIITVSILSSFLVGFRPLDAGFDTAIYVDFFESIKYLGFNDSYTYNFKNEYLFRGWCWFLSVLDFNSENFIYVTSLTSILLFVLALKTVFRKYYLMVFLMFFCSPGFVSIFGNAIRQGFAMSFLFIAIYYFNKRNFIMTFILIVVTFLFHNFTGVFLGLILLVTELKKELSAYTMLLLALFFPVSVLLLQGIMYSIYPSPYLELSNSSYFYHYSYLIFIFNVIVTVFIAPKVLHSELKSMFYIYFYMVVLATTTIYNHDAFGRFLYIQYPLTSFFLIVNLKNMVVKSTRGIIEVFIYCVIFCIGLFFLFSNSTIETLN